MAIAPEALTTASPYYLHPSDHPGLTICPILLTHDNYQEWCVAMKNAFSAKRKLDFITGKITEPAVTSTDYPYWVSVNSMLVGWTMTAIDPTVRRSVSYFATAKALWDELKQRFDVANGPKLMQLRSELARCHQDGENIASYFGRLKKLWEEITTNQTIVCTCVCSCGNKTKKEEEEEVHQFLMGLDDENFSSLRSAVVVQEPLPKLNKVYSMAVQEERLKTIVRDRDTRSDSVAFHASQNPRPPPPKQDKSKLFCVHCNKTGHDSAGCFKIIGYPEWWNNGRGVSNSKTGAPTKQPIRTEKSTGKAATAIQGHANHTADTGGSSKLTASDKAAIGRLTNDQWAHLLDSFKMYHANAVHDTVSGPDFEDGDWSG